MELRNHHIDGFNWIKHRCFIQSVNLVLGIIFLSLGCVFFIINLSSHHIEVNEALLLLAGGLALWAGVTKYSALVYLIDLALGLLLIL